MISQMNVTDYRTPGQWLQALLENRGWSQRVLAVVLGINETAVSKIILGKQAVDAALALALGEVFSIEPDALLELQKQWDLAQARAKAMPDPARATRAHLFSALPIAEMIKRSWINATDVRDVAKVESELVRFFGSASLDEIEILPHAAKKTNVAGGATPAQLAWLYRVKAIACEMVLKHKYSPQTGRAAVAQLKELLLSAEEARKVPRILAESGIRFVLVESLPGANIDGVCFWLADYAPVIGMSMRHDRIDNFWFVLRHELEHVLRGHGRAAMMLDADLEGERAGTGEGVAEEERQANEAAADFCVSQNALARFIARKAPLFAERDFLGFSRTLRIHPGLVAGQLQHKTDRYDRFRQYQVKIRRIVAPGAMVDGWGDIVPLGE